MNEASNIAQLESDLEDYSGDQDTRIILADLYESIGDPIAETLRWMVDKSRRPCNSGNGFGWSRADGYADYPSRLPRDIFKYLKGSKPTRKHSLKRFKSCKEATIQLHEALTGKYGRRLSTVN